MQVFPAMLDGSPQPGLQGEVITAPVDGPEPASAAPPTLGEALKRLFKRLLPTNRMVTYGAAGVIVLGGVIGMNQPTLRISTSGSRAVVHVETLGGFATTIRHIRILEMDNDQVLLDMVTENGSPELKAFQLAVGENFPYQIRPEGGEYRVVEPSDSAPVFGTVPDPQDRGFFLREGKDYKITVWGDGLLPANSTFSMGQ
jgi:hypothetical protein